MSRMEGGGAGSDKTGLDGDGEMMGQGNHRKFKAGRNGKKSGMKNRGGVGMQDKSGGKEWKWEKKQ